MGWEYYKTHYIEPEFLHPYIEELQKYTKNKKFTALNEPLLLRFLGPGIVVL